jgi:hypothetical protein
MMRASYFDPVNDKTVEIPQCSEGDVLGLLDVVMALRSQRGHPALELTIADGATLSLSTDGESAYLGWTSSLGDSFHSVGNDQNGVGSLVFDYFGSWSETPRRYLVSVGDALLCMQRFFLTGTADTDRVHFEPD